MTHEEFKKALQLARQELKLAQPLPTWTPPPKTQTICSIEVK